MQDLENLGLAIYVVIPVIGVIGMFFACICGGRDCPVQKGFSILLYCCMWFYIIFGSTGLDEWWYGSQKFDSAWLIWIILIWIIQMVESYFSNVKKYFAEMGSKNDFNETLEEVRLTNPIITFRIGNYNLSSMYNRYIICLTNNPLL